jgi:hypothetical protein
MSYKDGKKIKNPYYVKLENPVPYTNKVVKLGEQPRVPGKGLVFKNAAGGWVEHGPTKTYNPNDKSTYIPSAKDNTSYNKPKKTIGKLKPAYLETNYIAAKKSSNKSYKRKDDTGPMVADTGGNDRKQSGKLNLQKDPTIYAFNNPGLGLSEAEKTNYMNKTRARTSNKAYMKAHKDGVFAITTQKAKLGDPSFKGQPVVENKAIVKQQITADIVKKKNKGTVAELSTTGAGILGNVKGNDRLQKSLLYRDKLNQLYSGSFDPNNPGKVLSSLENKRAKSKRDGKIYETKATKRYKSAYKSGIKKLRMLQKARSLGA